MEPRRIIPPTPPFGQPIAPKPVAKPGAVAAVLRPGAPMIPLDASGRIAGDIPCRKCGYNLRGLLPDSRCPECGTPIGRSLHGDFLRFSDPDWVQRLATGMNWIVASILIGMLGGVFGAIFLGMFSSVMSSRAFFIIAPFSGLFFGLIALVGYWKVTTPDPAQMSAESNLSARRMVRIAQLTKYAVVPVNSLMQQLAWTVPSIVTGTISGILGLVGTVAVFIYGRKLALRIPDEKLARHCRIVMWGIAFMLSFSVAFSVFMAIAAPMFPATAATATSSPAIPTTGSSGAYAVNYSATVSAKRKGVRVTTTVPTAAPTPSRMALVTGFGCVMAVCGLTFGIWSLILIFKFRRLFKESAQIARRTWAAQPLSPLA